MCPVAASAMPSPTSFELLEVFAAIADGPSISAAARQLDMSSSQATRKLAQLESTLGVRLFNRTTRAVKLTDAGAIVLEWARDTLAARAEMAENVAALSERPSGAVRVAANHYLAAHILPGFLRRFALDYPEISIRIITTDSVVKLVEEGFDVALHAGRLPDSSLVGIRLREFRRVLCAAPDYLQRVGTPRQPRDLVQHRCLMNSTMEASSWFFQRGDDFLVQPLAAHVLADNQNVLHELALAGVGIASLSEWSADPHLASGRLVRVLPDYTSVSANGQLPDLRVLYPTRRLLRRVRTFVDALVAYLQTARPGVP